jgi:hypothetical protein
VYPNPVVEGEITIESTIENINEIQIYDLTGKQILSIISSGIVYKMSTDELQRGIYLFQIKTTNQTFIKRVLIL